MKFAILSLTAALGLVTVLGAPPAFAGEGHGPEHGGVVREMHGVTYELVARPDSLTLHISDHSKKIATEGAKAEAVIYANNGKTPVTLAPAGDNRMQAKGNFKVGIGVRSVVTVTLAGKSPVKLAFNLK